MERQSSSLIAVRFPALASRDYVLFVTGQLISVIGTWMQATALPYLAYRMTGRPLDLGLIGFSSTLPTLLFALPAGVLVERWDKRRTVIIFQALMSLQAFALAYLSYTGKIQIWQIIFLAFFYGSMVAVEVTARQSMLIELTGRRCPAKRHCPADNSLQPWPGNWTIVRRLDHCRDGRRVGGIPGEWHQLPVRDRRAAHCPYTFQGGS